MYEIIQKAHYGWAYFAIAILFSAAFNAIIARSMGRDFTPTDRRIGLFALIATHVQLLIGLIVYFVSPLGLQALGNMSNADLRLTSLEHPIVNILAIVLITMGWAKHKKRTTSKGQFGAFAAYYSIGFVLILSRLPWDLWF